MGFVTGYGEAEVGVGGVESERGLRSSLCRSVLAATARRILSHTALLVLVCCDWRVEEVGICWV